MLQASAASYSVAKGQDRRRHSRVPLSLLGRYMLPNFREYPCQTRDVSPGGVLLLAPVKAEVGQRVIVYLEHLGRIEGLVTRQTADGFAMTISATGRKREKLASQLTWLVNKNILGLPEDRRHERVVPRNTRNTITLSDGTNHSIRLLDVSLSGAAFQSEIALLLGDQLMLGRTPCKVVRKFADGYAVEFARPIAEELLDESIQL
ncbi:MAG: PilZ domain-containing protein [Bosea sp. (in: a-proteobacteria)]